MQLRLTLAALVSVGSVALAGCAGDDLDSQPSSSSGNGPVTISGQNFPEATLVAAMYSALLDDAGYTPEVKLVDSRDAYMATFPDTVDVVPEYVGGIVNFLNARENGADAKPFTAGDGAELADQGEPLLEKAGINLLQVSEATDTNAFFVTQEYAEANGLEDLSDLKGTSVVLAAAPDCEGRLDCEGGLSDQYGIDVTKVLPLGYASNQTYQAVLDGEAEVGETSTTDGTLESQGLVVLKDDKRIQPAQNLVPAVSQTFLDENPEVVDALNPLMEALTTEKLTELNGKVAVDRQQPEDVARQFLLDEGLL